MARMKLAIDSQEFEYDLGIKIMKAKYKTFAALKEGAYLDKSLMKLEQEWDEIPDVTVNEALSITNLESRRICFRYIGIDKIFRELKPELVDKQTITKGTRVTKEGAIESFDDTYELYLVKGEKLGTEGRRVQDFFILRCKCTSTDREYLIYIANIWNRSGFNFGRRNFNVGEKPDAIEAVAWTIQVEVPETHVDKIIRAGDCIMVKPKAGYQKCQLRHISKKEYLEKLVMES